MTAAADCILHDAHVTCFNAHILNAAKRRLDELDEDTVVKPEPLPELPAVLPFDFAYLPNALRGFVHDIAERMTSLDFPAVAVFVMVAILLVQRGT